MVRKGNCVEKRCASPRKIERDGMYICLCLMMPPAAKYGTGPDEAHQPEAKIRTGPHHKGQKAARICTAKARDTHQICCLKSSSTKLCLLIFVRKYLSAKLHSHFFVPKIFFHESSSTKFHPEIEICGTLCAKLCKFLQFAYILAHEGSQRLLKPGGW